MPRYARGPGVSFFAFQDIVTAVVGIFILITLIMVLELLEKVDSASRSPAGDAAAIERLIDQIKADADSIEQQLARLQQVQHRDDEAIVASAGMNNEQLMGLIEIQQKRSAELARQVQAVRKQLDDSQSRLNQAKLDSNEKVREIDSRTEQLMADLSAINARTEKLKLDDSPLYNGTLASGRTLVIIRLGDHPDSSARVSMREGDRKRSSIFVDVDSLISSIKKRNRKKSHYLVMVAPGGANDFGTLRDYFDSTNPTVPFALSDSAHAIRYGFDVIGSSDNIKMTFEVDE